MISQEAAIYSILVQNNIKLVKPEIIKYFSGFHQMVLENIFLVVFTKQPLTIESVKNQIAQRGYNSANQSAVLGTLERIVQKSGYSSVLNHEKGLIDEYSDNIIKGMREVVDNADATTKMKNDAVIKAADDLGKIISISDVKHHEEIIREMVERHKNKEPDEVMKRSVRLKNQHLINIFSEYIYPQFYCILAKPNDYKTTLLLNLILEFDNLGKKVLLLSLEDSSEMAAIKTQSIRSGIGKAEIVKGDYEYEKMKSFVKAGQGNITYMDMLRTPRKIQADINGYLQCYDVDLIAVDFIQRSLKERNQSEYENISQMADVLLEINKEHKIPIVNLSQAPKDMISSRNQILGLGDEKGAGQIAHNSRYSLSINSDPTEPENSGYRLINIYKTTFSAKGQVKVWFDRSTGKLSDTKKI